MSRTPIGPLPKDAPKSIYGLMAGKRLARQIANKAYAKRAANIKKLEPTYRIHPVRSFSSCSKQAYETVQRVVDASLQHYDYRASVASNKCKEIVQEVQTAVKRLRLDRYKFVCTCVIGKEQGHDLQQSSRCCWNPDTDSHVTYTYSKARLFCTVTVFAVYHD